MTDDTRDLSVVEREAFARLARTLPVDAAQEERTVRALRMEGLIRTTHAAEPRRGMRPIQAALAIAAGLACFFAGLWSERAGLWGDRGERVAVRGVLATQGALADGRATAPVIRF